MKLFRVIIWGVGVGIWTLVMAGSAMASSTSVSEQHEFRLGVMEGVEEQSQPGSIKLKAAGEWEQRAWKTPDVALTTGTAVESDGSYVYVLAGASTWFARYNPDTNDWETLAAAPHTGYYGADLLYLDGAIYAIFGNYQNTFAKYDIESDSWSTLANAPDLIYRGGSLATDGVSIYALRGAASTDFWRYTLGTNSWSVITSTPATINQGASLTYDNGYLYTPRGGNTNTFYRYSIATSTWASRTNMTSAINDDSNATVRDGYIYILLNNATTTFYRYSISGNSWSTMATTPQATRYVGLTYNSSDDQIYVFRGNGTYEMWKYDPDTNSYAGPVDLSATPGSGADLVYYNGYIYQPRGNNSNAFYRYSVAGGTWSSLTNAPGNFNDDTTGVAAGAYLYFFLGSNTTTFYRYDPAGNSWTTLTAAPATIRYGGSLSYPGSGDYIYATRGQYTRSFFRYSISGNSWDDGSVADLPDNSEASYGARLLSDGTDIYYLSGSRTGALLKYTIGSNSWSAESILPYAPYWGTDAVYYGGDIFIQAGYYKDDFWRYRIATGVWQWMSGVAQYYSYDAGPYNGGALAVDPTTGVLYSIIGANILNMESMTIDANDYLSSGTWTSAVWDLSYVTAWEGITATVTTPSDSSISYQTRSSTDNVTWSDWESVTAGVIASPARRYLQVKVTLTADTAQSETPSLADLTVSYQGDTSDPTNPSSVVGTSTEMGGTSLVSGQTYRYNYPYFSWSGASDPETGIAGYYVYFGTQSDADPVTAGNYQTTSDWVVTNNLTTGTYYLRLASRDGAGNTASATTAFTYVYQGVVATSVAKTTSADFADGTATDTVTTSDEIKLAGKAGYWLEDVPGLTPANLYYGSSLAYVESSNKLYATRGSNSNTFYQLDMSSGVWSSLANAPATVGYGGEVVEGPNGYLYALRGVNTTSFWRYDIAQNSWDDGAAADSPQTIYYGSSMVYDNEQYIYALRGNNDDTFLRYDTSSDEWSSMTSVDFGAVDQQVNNTVSYGGDLAYDGSNTVYAVQGNTRTGFAAYDIVGNSWTVLPKTPAQVYQGGQIEYDATTNAVYLIPGWGRANMYKYDVETEEWSELTEGPATFGLGTGMKKVGEKLYITRANNTRSTYIYDMGEERWLVPTRAMFGPMFQGSDIRTIGTGADLVKGSGNYLYMTRGNNDNLFVRHDTSNGVNTELAGVPSGLNSGAALVYESTNNKVYATASTYDSNFYVYDVSSNSWSREESDPLPADPASGTSLVYDNSRYIYWARAGGTASFYRFDTQGSAGSKWSALTNITATVSTGSQLVYKDGYIYVMRGGGTNPNPLYRYDTIAGTWSSMTTLTDQINTDGFLVDGGNGYLYACRASNTRTCYRYSIAQNSWSSITDAPGEIYYGGSAVGDNAGKIYVLAGSSGNTSFNNGLYTYVVESDTTSFEEAGSFETGVLDLGEVYRYGNLQVTYTAATNATLTVSSRSSADGSVWNSWISAGEEKHNGSSYEYKINSPVNPYLQLKFELASSDGMYSGVIGDYTVGYYSDTVAPSNASELTAYSTATMSATLTTNTWYNYGAPYFTWPEPEESGGASDTTTGSAVAGYYVYFGTESETDPETAGTWVTTNGFTASGLVSGETYYLRMKSKDDAGNVSASVWESFIYKYDGTVPAAPTGLAADPSGYSAVNDFDFSWDSVLDAESGISAYCYKTATASGTLASDNCVESTIAQNITGYQTGTNTFYVRARDVAGNYSAYTTGSYYYNNGSPSAPTALTVTPSTNTVNSFEFDWEAPNAYYGSLANLKYYYSVNALPTAASVSRAYSSSLGASSYATLPGENVLYVVVMDEAGNIDYSNYASVKFYANTTAPGIPTNLDIADVSVKASSSWKLALSWEEPDSVGAGVASYQVHRSSDGESFVARVTTSGISHVDTGLTQQIYYYKVRACDSANNCGAFSDVVSLLPDGKFTSPAPLVGEPEVTGITTVEAEVEWTTSRTSDSKIAYGTGAGDYFSEEVGNSDQVTKHELTLNNLTPGTTYYFTAKWTDEDGNLGSSEEYSFSTEPAPSAAEVVATAIGIDSANIQFTSSHASKARVYYGTTSTFGGYSEIGVGVAESTYTVPLEGLEDGTKYYYKITLYDSEDNEYDGDIYSFETLPRPKISAVKLQQVKGTATGTVLITWSTNTPISSILTYYPSANPAGAADAIDVKLKTAHRKVVGDLLPNTAYTLIVKGRDKAGNEASSEPQTFTTSADTRPPSIANLRVEPVVEGVGEEATAQLVVSWDTDELSTSQVAFAEGTSGTLSSKSQLDSTLTYNHMVVIPNLQPSKVYHLVAISADEGKNEAQSVERVVITQKATKSALNLVISNLSQAFGFLDNVGGAK